MDTFFCFLTIAGSFYNAPKIIDNVCRIVVIYERKKKYCEEDLLQ